jgi:hypothetical protein
MKLLVSTLLAFALSASAGRAVAGCGDNVGDAEAVAAARAQVAADCDCAGTPSHGAYVSCAAGVANERANAEPPLLPKYCKGAVKKCAARSTCGKPGFVACCRTSSSGKTKCSTKRDAEHCIAPAGGAACTSDPAFSSCCDACTDSGCAAPPTATTVP